MWMPIIQNPLELQSHVGAFLNDWYRCAERFKKEFHEVKKINTSKNYLTLGEFLENDMKMCNFMEISLQNFTWQLS